jgi:hypothetical protein
VEADTELEEDWLAHWLPLPEAELLSEEDADGTALLECVTNGEGE